MQNIQTLNDLDAEILRFIRTNSSASVNLAEKELTRIDAIEIRIKSLDAANYICRNFKSYKDGSLTRSKDLGTYSITDKGRKALQDYDHSTKKARKELWLKNAWIPVIVSFVTTVLTNYILPRIPALLEWFRHTLAKIVS